MLTSFVRAGVAGGVLAWAAACSGGGTKATPTPAPEPPLASAAPEPAPIAPAEPVPPPPDTLPEAMALGDCATVIRLAQGATEADDRGTAARLAVAECHLRNSRPKDALAVLADTGPDAGALGGYRRLLRAEASVDAGDADAAAATLTGLALPGATGDEVRLLRGRLGAERGDAAAKVDLTALLSSDLGPEARWWLAVLARAANDGSERAALNALWLDARPGGWDGKAAARLAELGNAVPDVSSAPGRDLARKRLEALHAKNRVNEAKALSDQLAEVEPPKDRAQWILLGQVRYAARDYKGTLDAWRNAYGAPDAATGSPSELFDYALCHARAGDYDTAAVVYQRVIAQHPTTDEADFASFKLGYMEYDRQQCAAAVPLFDAHAARYPASKHLDEALWFSARCAWKGGDRAGAAKAWADLEAKRPKSSLVPGAAYWRARALGLGGDAAGEQGALGSVISRWPVSGYAWLAAERLGRTFPVKPVASPPAWPEALAGRPEVVRAEALLTAGLRRWAAAELGALPAPADRGASLALGWAKLRSGDIVGAKTIGCKLAESAWKDGDPVAQQLCTPRPEPGVVAAYTHGIDPSIVYGIMVAESALDPSVSSAVGARGLMQLMPDEVAKLLHPRLFPGRPYVADDLFSAPYNAALGATELSDKAKALAGVLSPSAVPAVVASYNGGEEAVRRWIGVPTGVPADPPPSDDFTEDIGYVETRGYVKRVLGFAMAYRWVYGDGAR